MTAPQSAARLTPVLLSSGVLLTAASGSAQVETGAVCRPSQVLHQPLDAASLASVKITLDGRVVSDVQNIKAPDGSRRRDVTAAVQSGKNTLVVKWVPQAPRPFAASVVRVMDGVNGSSSTVVTMVPETYRNLRRLSFTFVADKSDAPCAAYGKPARDTLNVCSTTQGDRVVEWAAEIDGKDVALTTDSPSMMNAGRTLDLTRFLAAGTHTVTLHGRRLSAQSPNARPSGAQISRRDGGKTTTLLTLISHQDGLSGKQSVTITVKRYAFRRVPGHQRQRRRHVHSPSGRPCSSASPL